MIEVPGISSSITDIADFLEARCILSDNHSYSLLSARNAMSGGSDELDFDGIIDDDDRIMNKLEEALQEIESRKRRCNQKYPFKTECRSITLEDSASLIFNIYSYLLFATLWNMGSKRIMNGIDGTLLFEEISEIIAKSYFGNNTKSMIFGTGSNHRLTFKQKVERLLVELNEGGEYKEPAGSQRRQKDGKLDIVVWKPFSDKRPCQFIGMGQCKTGSSWEDYVSQMNPMAFFGSYTTLNPFVPPIRMFFVAASCKEGWEELFRSGGIFFDRCRIMDYLPESLDDDLFARIQHWLSEIIRVCVDDFN